LGIYLLKSLVLKNGLLLTAVAVVISCRLCMFVDVTVLTLSLSLSLSRTGDRITVVEAARRDSDAKLLTFQQQLLSKVADKEAASAELMRRFLPILNAKKDKIRELEDTVRELEASGLELPEPDIDSGREEEEGATETEPVRCFLLLLWLWYSPYFLSIKGSICRDPRQ
jgi:hypothetical protein